MRPRVVWSALAVALLAPAAARAQMPPDLPPIAPAPAVDPQAVPPPNVVVVPYPAPPGAVPYGVPPYPPAYGAPPPSPYELPPEHEPPLRPARPTGFSFKIWAGPAYRRIYDISIPAADFGMSFGGRGWYGEIGALLGRTDHGLLFWQLRPQATGEANLGRVRLGGGAGFTVLGVERVTTGSFIVGAGIGLSGFVTVDLVQSDRHALYLGAKMVVDWLPGGSTDSDGVIWGPSAALGYRF
ncbi:MAG: hypothetical protein QM820_01865 [Minicystis sp.]